MRTLARSLGLTDLTLLTIGLVIGSGIYIVPATVLRQTGGRFGLAALVWLVAGVLTVLGALTFGELGAMKPEAGGLYVYLRDAFGPLTAFLYGWALFFLISSGSVAALAVAFAGYLRELVDLGPGAARAVAVGMIVVIAVVNVRGTRHSAGMQNWTTGFKVAAIVGVSLFLIVRRGSAATAAPAEALPQMSMGAGLGLALVGVLWAYEGWQYASFSAGETVDPQRTFPRAILLGTAALVAIYLLANFGYVSALGPDRAARSERIAAEAVSVALGPAAGKLIALAILVSMFSAANGLTLTAPRVYFAMARDGVFFRRLAEVHPRFGTPAVAVVASSAWAAVLAATGTFEQLLTYVVFTAWGFYALGAASLFYYRRHQPDLPRPFRVPGHPWTPLLFMLSAMGIVLSTLVSQPGRAVVGIGLVLLGAPAFWLWAGRNPPAVPVRTE